MGDGEVPSGRPGMMKDHGIRGRKPSWRSRLFWLGLPGLVFLLWTSLLAPSSLAVLRVVEWTTVLEFQRGGIFLVANRDKGSNQSVSLNISRTVFGASPHTEGWWSFNRSKGPWARHQTKVYVAHWILLLGYLFSWVAIMTGWQRWKRRRMKEEEP